MTTKAEVIMEVDGAADDIYRLLADWDGICDWAPKSLIQSCRLEGDVRHLVTGDGRNVAEQLEMMDPITKELCFSIVGPAPGGIEDYFASVLVEPLDGARSRVSWVGRMTVPEGADADRFAAGFQASYRTLIESVAKAARDGK